jgi:Zn-dependent peptidase ImmA (M78 family)
MGVAQGTPVDVHGIGRVWAGLSIVEENIDGPGYLLPLGRIGAEIIVRQSDPIERKRFTIAHEVGHWILGITLERKTGEFQQPAGVPHGVIEKWCDTFAATFLLPRQSIIDYFDVPEQSLVSHLLAAPRHFKVSEEALFLRAYEVLGMRVAYFDTKSLQITRAFVRETVRREVECALATREVRDWLYMDTLTVRVYMDSVEFLCCWEKGPNSKRGLLLLCPRS